MKGELEVSSFWHTRTGYMGIGLMELLSIKSWLDHGYTFCLYTYDLQDEILLALNGLYENFILRDANEILGFDRFFLDDRGAGVAGFSDFFRFHLLHKGSAGGGGVIWVDLDMICLNCYDYMKQDYIFSQEIDRDPKKPRITTSLLKFPPRSELGWVLTQEAEKLIIKSKVLPWGVIGPRFLEKWCKELNLQDYALDYRKTCQIPWPRVRELISSRANIDEGEPCLHLFSERWRTDKLDKNYFYSKGIYAKLLHKHRIGELIQKLPYAHTPRKFFKLYEFYADAVYYKRLCVEYCVKKPLRPLKRVFFPA